MSHVISPGSTLGILGSGQLGRMFSIAAHRLGYRVQVYSPDAHSPAGQVSDAEWVHPYEDLDSLQRFASAVDVVTLEFENVPAVTMQALDRLVPLRPGPAALHHTQNRLREKLFLRGLGLPTAPFQLVQSAEELTAAVTEFQHDAIIKTTSWGYDGKGQHRVQRSDDLAALWSAFQQSELLVERIVPFVHEFSVIGVRGVAGEFTAYDPFLNRHSRQILDVTHSPAAEVPTQSGRDAQEIVRRIMIALEAVGVLCVELFLLPDGGVVVNEIAPRPHNSGHLTIDAHRCCQFEQQVRAICGLPLGSTIQHTPAAMANLLGDLWSPQPPDFPAALRQPNLKLHLYGKQEARPGRKMGHLTCLDATAAAAALAVIAARTALTASAPS